jgi:predicted secreted protein
MNFIGLTAIYFVTWFISLLGILPFGVERNNHPEAGHDAGRRGNCGCRGHHVQCLVGGGIGVNSAEA